MVIVSVPENATLPFHEHLIFMRGLFWATFSRSGWLGGLILKWFGCLSDYESAQTRVNPGSTVSVVDPHAWLFSV